MPVDNPSGTPGIAPSAIDKPHPALAAIGFHGPVSEFNHRVDTVVQSYQQAHGTPPPAGLALDVVKSPVPTLQLPKLFKPEYGSPQQARLAGAVAQDQRRNPDGYMVQRTDGVVQPHTPLYDQHVAETPAQLTKKYPMVTMGALPIPGADQLGKALRALNTPVPDQSALGTQKSLLLGYSSGLSSAQQAAEYGRSNIADTIGRTRFDVQSVQQAKQQLARVSGLTFSSGPVFNQDDAQKVSNWMKSEDYFKKQLAYQAQQAGQTVGQYVKSWNAKWGPTSPVHKGLVGHFLSALPQQLWGHGGIWGDLASIPSYLKGSSDNPLNIGLHGLTRTAGLTLNVVGGAVDQVKADASAGTTFAAYMAGLHGSGKTYEQAITAAREQLRATPSWMRIFGVGFLPEQLHGRLAYLDQAVNIAGDLILLRKPAFTGEKVAAGNIARAQTSDYLRAASHWAFQDLKTHGVDGVGRAAARLERGQGATGLVARAAKLVQSGDMTEEQFASHVADLYAHGATEIAGKTVEGPLLSSLRTDKIPAPGKAGRAWLDAKTGIRNWLDNYDNTGLVGTKNAVDLVNKIRAEVAHAAPQGARLGYFQDILPEQVFNFVRKHELGDDQLANKLESRLVRYQGTENVRGIQNVERMLQRLWHQKYPDQVPPGDEPFHALISTEAPSVFHFPSGTEQRLDHSFQSIGDAVSRTNKMLNKLAKIHARIILSGVSPLGLGGFSLFWKHTIGDGIRAVAAGVTTLMNPATRDVLRDLDKLARDNPAVEREYGAFLERIRTGETAWALNRGGGHVFSEAFKTGEKFDKHNYMTAAGGYLRRHLTAPELDGYRNGNLVDTILHDPAARGVWKSAAKRDPGLTADAHAHNIAQEYGQIEDALRGQGLTWDDALNTLRENRGKEADAALGRFIRDNRLGFDVRGGQIEKVARLDDLTSRWVGNVIMRPNKLWRTAVGRASLATNYQALIRAGFEPRVAFSVAADTAEAITKYHMLDFANRLQIEQDLRWLSYFATKHRLYWKWVLGSFLRHPGYVAVVNDFKKTLNQTGGWTLPLKVFGLNWQIPLERLVWVPGKEYDETSPLALAAINFAKSGGNLDAAIKGATGTQGNILTRSDTATFLGTKLLKIETGLAPGTYGYATSGLDKTTADKVTRAINEYQQSYFLEHGHYAPEAYAVKIVLASEMGQEYWRANLPLPVVPEQNRTSEQQLMAEYMAHPDPKWRRAFLDKNPGLAQTFGVYEDPKVKMHNDTLFRQWDAAVQTYREQRAALYANAKRAGQWTTQDETQRRELSTKLEQLRNQLLVKDARQWGIDTHGLVPNGDTVPYGPWGKLVNKDPSFDPTHFLSTLFPKLALKQGDVIGPLQRQMQHELSLLNDQNYVNNSGYTPDEVRTRKRELLQSLEVFKSYPSDALGVVRDKYQSQYVNKYWAAYDAKVNEIKNLPSGDRAAADSAFRAWRDSQDHPVKINGITFPSPIRMAWAMLDPKTKQERLAYLASKPVTSLANYELDLLGMKHPANMSLVWEALDNAKAAYRKQYPGQSISKIQIQQAMRDLSRQPGYHDVYSFYVNTVSQPRIRQFQQTSLYQDMPATVRSAFDQYIGRSAIEVAKGIAANGHSSYYKQQWANAVKNQIQPWLDDPAQKQLREYLAPFGPNFLYTLVGS